MHTDVQMRITIITVKSKKKKKKKNNKQQKKKKKRQFKIKTTVTELYKKYVPM